MLTYILFHLSDTDLKTRQIPNKYPAAIIIIALAAGVTGLIKLNPARVNLALIVLIITALFTGFGDAKLFASLSLLLGPQIFSVITISFILAGAYSCARLVSRELKFHDTIAFAPFISVPALVVWIEIIASIKNL